MNKLMTFCLLLAFALPVFAVDDGQVTYAGGTVPALPAGIVGRLDTTSEVALTFEHSGTKLLIPYSAIESFEYSTEVTRHLGVMPAIAVGLVKMRRRRHFSAFRIAALITFRRLRSSRFPNTCHGRSKPSSRPEFPGHASRET